NVPSLFEQNTTFSDINDALSCSICHEFEIPAWKGFQGFCGLARIASKSLLQAVQGNGDLLRLQVGGLVRQLLSDLTDASAKLKM
ncbi:hypothetical protein Q6288_28040, partial [Klebsiella quasipneumoniae]|uniref:hypothetical protein n=1 Tax=Klebsiella quasipneumoniae TaxID=1463165 RepID=UPI0027306C07